MTFSICRHLRVMYDTHALDMAARLANPNPNPENMLRSVGAQQGVWGHGEWESHQPWSWHKMQNFCKERRVVEKLLRQIVCETFGSQRFI